MKFQCSSKIISDFTFTFKFSTVSKPASSYRDPHIGSWPLHPWKCQSEPWVEPRTAWPPTTNARTGPGTRIHPWQSWPYPPDARNTGIETRAWPYPLDDTTATTTDARAHPRLPRLEARGNPPNDAQSRRLAGHNTARNPTERVAHIRNHLWMDNWIA